MTDDPEVKALADQIRPLFQFNRLVPDNLINALRLRITEPGLSLAENVRRQGHPGASVHIQRMARLEAIFTARGWPTTGALSPRQELEIKAVIGALEDRVGLSPGFQATRDLRPLFSQGLFHHNAPALQVPRYTPEKSKAPRYKPAVPAKDAGEGGGEGEGEDTPLDIAQGLCRGSLAAGLPLAEVLAMVNASPYTDDLKLRLRLWLEEANARGTFDT